MSSRIVFFGRRHRSRVPSRARLSGITLVESIGMLMVVGILGGMAFPAIGGLRQAGLDQQAIGVAQAINQAQQTYQLRVANAVGTWSGATDSGSRYQLITGYIPYAADTLADYTPPGYTLALGATLNTKVSITGPNGAISY